MLGDTTQAADDLYADALLALIRAAGKEGVTSATLRLGVRMVHGQETLLPRLEAAGRLTSELALFPFSGRVWYAVMESADAG